MAENGIEILVEVLTSEGVDSLEDIIKVLTDAAGKADVLSDSIDDLDASLTGIAKSGASAEDMAATMVTTLEDFGVEAKDAEGLAAALAGALTKVGVAGEKAAGGIDLATKSNEELTGSADAATDAVERQSAAVKTLGITSEATASAVKGLQVGMASSAIMQDAAVANLGSGYARMTSLAELATPALMKAATWAGIGLAGLAYEGIKQYTQFNKLITQTITQAGEAPSKMGFLTNLAESVAKSTGANLDDVANTIYRAASGTASWNSGLGATQKQLANIVTTVSKLNVVGGIAPGAESEQSSRVVTALLNANVRGVGRSPIDAAALVNAVVGSGDIRYSDLVPAVGRGLLASAVANNVTAKDALSWVDTLTSQGTTGSVAGNYVKTGINLLMHPSAQGVDALAMLGIKPGELENLAQGPGGLTAALKTLKAGMAELNPGNASQYFYHEAGVPYPGGQGLAGAVAKLQTWSAGELSPAFIKNWEAGKLTPLQQTQATDLILTKAFGGSKQFATIAGVINHLPLYEGIESHISKEDTPAYFNAQYARTAATPSQQFKRMGQNLLVDLVNIGKTLTPLGLTFGHVITDVIGGLSKFKGVITGFAVLAAGLLGAAGIGKLAQLGSHLAPLIGAGYNRLGSMTEGSSFGTAMTENANSGRFKFLNIYGAHKGKLLSKLGGESINASGLPSTEALSADGTALNTNISKSNVLLEEIATNTRVTAGAAEEGDITGGGGLARVGGRGGTAEAEAGATAYAPQFRDPVTGRFLTTEESASIAARNGEEDSAAEIAALSYGAMGKGRSHLGYLKTGASGGADAAAENLESTEGIASSVESAAPVATTGLEDLAGGGMLSSLGEMAGGIMGGPVGMMGMMMAPMLIGALTPAFGKLGSLIGDWLGGGSTPVYNPHIKNPLDTTSAAARLAKATKNLRTFQREVKNKAGKEVWVANQSAELANMAGYIAAQKAYTKAGGQNATALRTANAVDMAAESYLYGSKKNFWSHLVSIDKSRGAGSMNNMTPEQQDVALKSYIKALPGGPGGNLQKAIWKQIDKHGTTFSSDYQNIISPALRNQHKYYTKVLNDASQQSVQFGNKHDKTFEALLTGGLFSNANALKLNRKQMSSFLNNSSTGAKAAAEYLPQYANKYHQIMLADKKALAATGASALTGSDRKAFEAQEKTAADRAKATDALIREMREASKDTSLSGESVDKLARQNASALVASGLPSAIASALAAAISPYIKTAPVQGTSSGSTRTVTPVPYPL